MPATATTNGTARPPGRLWIVSELYYPEQTSTGYFLTRIAEGLAADREVEVICGRPTYSERGQEVERREVRRGVTIHRMRATHFDKDRLLLRAINALTLSLSVLWFALRRFRSGDTVLVVTNPPTLPPLIGLVARLKEMRSVLLVHDVYPEVLVATGFLRPGSLTHRLLTRLLSLTYRLFRDIVVLGRDMEDVVRRKLGGAGARVAIIPNWGDADEIVPIAREANPFARRHGLVGKTVIQFSGNIGRTHDIETILEVAHRTRAIEGLVFLFVGYGGKTAIIEPAANLLLLPRQPRELLGPMLACADATIISFVDAMYGVSVPSRMYNVMAAGVPIVAVAEPASELALTVADHDAGWVLAQGDRAGLEALVRALAADAGAAGAPDRGARGRAAVIGRFTLPQVLDAYRALFAAGAVEQG